MIYLTSDTHFGHQNIIEYCNRPFETRGQMDEALIENWNSVVKPEDTIYHLGDFSFYNQVVTKSILRKLNGKIILVEGNHDAHWIRKVGFDSCIREGDLTEHKLKIYLAHHPLEELPPGIHKQFCGHVHSGWKVRHNKCGNIIVNVGVDVMHYKPISLDEAVHLFK